MHLGIQRNGRKKVGRPKLLTPIGQVRPATGTVAKIRSDSLNCFSAKVPPRNSEIESCASGGKLADRCGFDIRFWG